MDVGGRKRREHVFGDIYANEEFKKKLESIDTDPFDFYVIMSATDPKRTLILI
jgi:hypothetical protein